ncbi:hypothetical protein FB451DRAFT_3305 [Mycena latifolia]|nr:hypothetical protein FB451DRAFT_3305 [Mycena latifolia]
MFRHYSGCVLISKREGIVACKQSNHFPVSCNVKSLGSTWTGTQRHADLTAVARTRLLWDQPRAQLETKPAAKLIASGFVGMSETTALGKPVSRSSMIMSSALPGLDSPSVAFWTMWIVGPYTSYFAIVHSSIGTRCWFCGKFSRRSPLPYLLARGITGLINNVLHKILCGLFCFLSLCLSGNDLSYSESPPGDGGSKITECVEHGGFQLHEKFYSLAFRGILVNSG